MCLQHIRVNILLADRKSRKLIFSMRPKEKEETVEKKRSLMVMSFTILPIYAFGSFSLLMQPYVLRADQMFTSNIAISSKSGLGSFSRLL